MNEHGLAKPRRVTIRDVAVMAGVTPAVVSRLLNHDPELTILESTKERIYRAVEQTGYKANPMARGLRRKKTCLIGLIIVDFTNPFYGKLIRSIQEAVEQKGYTCLVSESLEDQNKTRKMVDLYLERQVEGLILCTATENDPIIDYLERIGEPYVLATRKAKNSTAPYAGFDNEMGMCEAMEHLISLGHRHIGHITGNMDSIAAQERLNGYKKTLAKHGIPINEDYIIFSRWSPDNIHEDIARLLSLREPPTAIVTCNDMVAIAALNAIYELGYRVPEDISLIGFNNVQESATTMPPLTTVESPMEQFGKKVTSLLFEVLDAPEKKTSKVIQIETKLIMRGSTAICRDLKRSQEREPAYDT